MLVNNYIYLLINTKNIRISVCVCVCVCVYIRGVCACLFMCECLCVCVCLSVFVTLYANWLFGGVSFPDAVGSVASYNIKTKVSKELPH